MKFLLSFVIVIRVALFSSRTVAMIAALDLESSLETERTNATPYTSSTCGIKQKDFAVNDAADIGFVCW